MIGVDNITAMAQDSIATWFSGRSPATLTTVNRPRDAFGAVTSGNRSKSVVGYLSRITASARSEVIAAKFVSGLFLFRAAVKAHAVVGSQVARPPEKTEPLAALYSRGDQNRVSGQNGVGVGLPRMATDADSSPAGDQRFKGKIAGVSQRLSMTKTCPEKAK